MRCFLRPASEACCKITYGRMGLITFSQQEEDLHELYVALEISLITKSVR
jgi:hypothetical protein